MKAAALIAAYFEPSAVRHARKTLGIQSQAAMRYERGVDIEALPRVLAQTVSYLAGKAAEIRSNIIDNYPRPRKPRTIIMRQRKANEILGVGIEESYILMVLRRAGFDVNSQQKGSWKVDVPAFRSDIERESDLIEDIGRYYGYDRIPPRIPQLDKIQPGQEKSSQFKKTWRHIMFHQGFDEAVNDSFMFSGQHRLFGEARALVSVFNPTSSRSRYLKNTLLSGLLENMRLNFAHGVRGIHLFESGRFFYCKDEKVIEKTSLAFISSGPLDAEHWQEKSADSDFFHVKGTCEALLEGAGAGAGVAEFEEKDFPVFEPGYSLAVMLRGETIGHVGKIKPSVRELFGLEKDVYAAELDLNALLHKLPAKEKHEPPALSPVIIKHLDFIDIQSIRYKDLRKAIESLNIPVMETFDIYERYVDTSSPGENVHLSLKFVFNHPERDMSEKDVDEYMQKIIQLCKQKFSLKLR